MFRAYLGPSSGGKILCMKQLVLIIFVDDCLLSWLDSLRWLSVVLVGLNGWILLEDCLFSWLDWMFGFFLDDCLFSWLGWMFGFCLDDSVVLVGLNGWILIRGLSVVLVGLNGWIPFRGLSVVLVGFFLDDCLFSWLDWMVGFLLDGSCCPSWYEWLDSF